MYYGISVMNMLTGALTEVCRMSECRYLNEKIEIFYDDVLNWWNNVVMFMMDLISPYYLKFLNYWVSDQHVILWFLDIISDQKF